MSGEKPRCRKCEFGATDARQYPCNKCKEIQNPRAVKNLADYYSKKKESV